VIGGMTALDDPCFAIWATRALGIVTTSWYSARAGQPAQQGVREAFRKQFKYDPGYYAGGTYVSAKFWKRAESAKGKCGGQESADGRDPRQQRGDGARRRQIRRIRQCRWRCLYSQSYTERWTAGQFLIKTYPDVSQFWTYDKTAFLKESVYSRDYPPAKNLEQ